MKKRNDMDRQRITNELVKDADGNVIAENVTCETVPRLRALDIVQYETMVENNRPTARCAT
jgi:hypothetical protein